MIGNRHAAVTLAMALGLLTACGSGDGLPEVTRIDEPAPIRLRGEGPPGSNPETCHGKDETPAVIETVTHHVEVPAVLDADGNVVSPASVRTEVVQEIVEEREALWFESLCPDQMTPEFVASVQRALAARGLYDGAAEGVMNTGTRAAIRAFQKPQGLNSSVLSLAAARQLGLIEVERITR
ncbi:peptidoglycan-binding domain-containing protein [Psychromarinibacter sp. S121]|uniref:peptidoglycan-binding domain-containing protein n=1 Tax=Psychromarinibacter sp. S121 TaxID=3415127 RepID=UPI003C7C56CE